MTRFEHILCPVDLSPCSRRALDHAVGVARWYGSRVTVLHVIPPIATFLPPVGDGLFPPIVLAPEDVAQFRQELTVFADLPPDLAGDLDVVQGSIGGEIVRFATELPADLVVMGTHGRSGFDRLMLGSTTEKLLRKAPCPVLTVPPRAPEAVEMPRLFARVLCAVDFSPVSLRALAFAQSIAAEAGAHLSVVHVFEPASMFEPVPAGEPSVEAERNARRRLSELIREDARAFTEATEVVASGKPYREILRTAADDRSDLIVLGAHGGALGLPAFGSTTNHVVRQAACPVLTVR